MRISYRDEERCKGEGITDEEVGAKQLRTSGEIPHLERPQLLRPTGSPH